METLNRNFLHIVWVFCRRTCDPTAMEDFRSRRTNRTFTSFSLYITGHWNSDNLAFHAERNIGSYFNIVLLTNTKATKILSIDKGYYALVYRIPWSEFASSNVSTITGWYSTIMYCWSILKIILVTQRINKLGVVVTVNIFIS